MPSLYSVARTPPSALRLAEEEAFNAAAAQA